MKNVLEYLEKTAEQYPDKLSFSDCKTEMTFSVLSDCSKRIGSFLAKQDCLANPEGGDFRSVLVLMDKTPECIASFFGAVYGGFAYIPAGSEMPEARIKTMICVSGACAVICDKANEQKCENLGIPYFVYDGILDAQKEPDNEIICAIRDKQSENDILYVMFTSGSTGTPKGVMIRHSGVIAYTDSLSDLLGSDEGSVYANQAPFYSDASLKEIYQCIRNGSTVYIVPQQLFLFPVKLVEFLNEKKINTLCWVSSALSFVSSLGAFDKAIPEYVKTVTFVGEVFPVKQLNKWRKALPDAVFYNLYGPTEVTGVCTAFRIDPEMLEFDESKPVPIGKPLAHSKIYLLDENGKEAASGEICVESVSLSPGYAGNPSKTAEVFTDNPAHPGNVIYRTGDLASYDREGNLVFASRKDFQIKHMGYRIELGEIESNAQSIDGLREVCCVYNEKNSKIVMYYSGEVTDAEIRNRLKNQLPRYMIPGKYVKMDMLPKNGTGKIDRKKLHDAETEKQSDKYN